MWLRLLAGVLAVAVAAAACAKTPGPEQPRAPGTEARSVALESNVRWGDYAGTQACARCHASYVESWLRSPMHEMTRAARGAVVRGPFDGTVFRFRDDSARLESAGADRFITVSSKRFGGGIYKLTRVIGGHYREDYAGVPVKEAREGAPPIGDPTEELVLPVSFVFATKNRPGTLRYKGYSVMVEERDGLKVGPVWNQTCIFCHNTVPYLSTVLGALAGKGVYQGEVVDPLLPASLRATYAVTNDAAMSDMVEAELARLGAKGQKPTLALAVSTTRSRFRASHLVEVGIGCEACHLGSAAHAKDPTKPPSLAPVSPGFEVRLAAEQSKGAEGKHATDVNRVCARCHQVLFSGYEPTWEGGARHRSPGGSQINSGEARDMMLGACASKLACTDCHDPHAHDGTAKLRRLEPAKEDALCTKCHGKLASKDALRAHSHHDPDKPGARCLACHMPQKNLSLDGGLSRYHRIGSPTDADKVLLDRPVECALCHGDKTVGSLVSTMETWWRKSYERGALDKLYGSLEANVLVATAERGKPHERAVAFERIGERRLMGGVPALKAGLANDYPLVRGYAKRALEDIWGRPVAVDVDQPRDVIERAVRELP